MKSKIVLVLFAVIAVLVLSSNSGGYGSNRTGATGSSGCGNCHGSTTSNSVTVELDSAGVPVTSYRAGMSYRIKIRAVNATGSSLPRFGFQLCAVRLTGAGSGSAIQAGTWGTLPPGVHNTGSSPAVIEQSQRLSPISGTGANGTVYADSIPWTAPATGTGSIKIYGVLNAVNNNNNNDLGDKYQVATPVTITEVVLASVNIAVTTGANPSCAGSNVAFTATPTNGGTAPSYQWMVNGSNVGTNSPTYSSTSLTTGQVVTCVMTSNLSGVAGNPATSNNITMTVNTPVAPTDTITVTNSTICAGAPTTFTAHPVNGGTSPAYQWKLNGGNVGTNSANYTSSTLANNDVVTCVMTSNSNCVTTPTSTSNPITMTVNPLLTPSVAISTLSTSVCAGSPITFTAVPTNGGATPSYQWKVNGGNVGTNSNTYTSNTLANGAVVTCVMTSNASCLSSPTATSNAITMTVNPIQAPTIHIVNNSSVCIATPDTFSAQITNGGLSPSFQWQVNGSNAGTNSSSFISSALSAGDIISCALTSSSACAVPSQATSNNLTVAFSAPVAPSVSISTGSDTICQNSSVTFTAIPAAGGSSPVYQWLLNGNNVGTNGNTYISSTLANGNTVSCIMTSNANCVTTNTATSNTVTMTVKPTVTPTVAIITAKDTVCQGSNVTFSASGTNLGTAASYQWQVNGNNAGANSNSYATTSLTNHAVVTCIALSNAQCALPQQATSTGITMTILSNPAASITPAHDTAICNGDSLHLTAGGGTNYTWSNSSHASVISTAQSGTYSLTVSDPNGCSASAGPVSVTVHTPAIPVITQSGNILTATLGTAYQWALNGTDIANATSENLTITQSGNYTVRVRDAFGCVATSASGNYIYTGIGTIGTDLAVSVYPIPNQGSFVIEAPLKDADVNITNIYGQSVYHQSLSSDKLEVNGEFPAGIYLVTVSQNGLSQSIKIQVTKD